MASHMAYRSKMPSLRLWELYKSMNLSVEEMPVVAVVVVPHPLKVYQVTHEPVCVPPYSAVMSGESKPVLFIVAALVYRYPSACVAPFFFSCTWLVVSLANALP